MTKYILTAILALTALSCGDFLEPKSQSEFVPKEANALNEMLLGEAYPKPSGSTSISAYLEIFNDDICCADTEGTLDDNSISFESGYQALFGWQPTMFITMEGLGMMPINIWESTYEFILGANAALDYVDGVTGTAEEKAYVKAQAYALRAFYYFLLVNTYGMPYNYDKTSLGVPLKLTSALENKFLERNTVDEVYQQIFEDLDNAEDLYLTLPREKQYQPDGKTSLPMVQLLKSRVYLYTENWVEAQRYAQKVIDEYGRIDILVNNVGISLFKPLTELSIEEFDHVIATNLRPAFITSRQLALHRQQNGNRSYGRIINLCSTRYLQSEAGTEAYSASKGGIYSLTHSLAVSLAPLHITVNAIAPGWIHVREEEPLRPEDHRFHPSGRVGTPDDIVRACLFLCDTANDFLNGQTLTIDGGATIRMIYPE